MSVTRRKIVVLVLAVLLVGGALFLGTSTASNEAGAVVADAKAKEAKAGG